MINTSSAYMSNYGIFGIHGLLTSFYSMLLMCSLTIIEESYFKICWNYSPTMPVCSRKDRGVEWQHHTISSETICQFMASILRLVNKFIAKRKPWHCLHSPSLTFPSYFLARIIRV